MGKLTQRSVVTLLEHEGTPNQVGLTWHSLTTPMMMKQLWQNRWTNEEVNASTREETPFGGQGLHLSDPPLQKPAGGVQQLHQQLLCSVYSEDTLSPGYSQSMTKNTEPLPMPGHSCLRKQVSSDGQAICSPSVSHSVMSFFLPSVPPQVPDQHWSEGSQLISAHQPLYPSQVFLSKNLLAVYFHLCACFL